MNEDLPIVEGDEIEPDESHTPTEFSGDEELTLEQAAQHAGCSALQIRDWIASGMLTPIADGSIERVSKRQLERVGDPNESGAQNFEREHGA